MKQIKMMMLLIALGIQNTCWAQTKVQIGDLYYNISGVTASVTYNRSYYTENDYTIVYRSNYRKSEYNIPSSINYNGYDYPVTSIEEGAFADQVKYKSDNTISYYNNLASPIKHITIPNSITHIGAYAFYNRYLDECNLPNVETIDEFAFACLSNFNTIIAPKLKQIGNYAFDDNRQLTELDCPSLEKVGNYAFKGCSGITTISMPQLKQIGENSFVSCANLSNVSFPKLEVIGKEAFKGCNKLALVILPETMTTMGEDVFKDCSLLRELFYLSHTPPTNWVATTMTYVPDKQTYTSPQLSINNAQIIEIITFDSNSFYYTGTTPSTTWENNVIGYNSSLSLNTISINVGQHEEWIPVTLSKDEASFTVEVVYRYTIKPIELTAKVENVNREYGEENPQFKVSYSGFVNAETESVITLTPTVNTTATKTSDVGEYPIIASGGSAKNYTFVYEPGILTVTKASLTAKVNDETRQYGKENPTFTISYTGLKNGETVPKWEEALKIETAATKTSDVGTYDVTATGIPTNYSLSVIGKGKLSITQAPLNIKADNATRKYYEEEPSFMFSCTGFLNDDNVDVLTKAPSFSTDATKTSNAGKYKITPSAAVAKNYTISYEQGELTITKRQLKATSHCSRFYGEENPLLPIEYDGFVNSETEEVLSMKPVGTTNATKTSTVGNYPITVNSGEATNYDFVYEQGVLTITKAPLSAKVKDATKVYGTQNPTFSIEYYGLKNGETIPAWKTAPTFQTEATKSSGVGQYAIKAVNGVPVNYDLEIADGTLSITPASLTIKANDATRKYFENEPSFKYSCTGFVNSDNVDVLTKEPLLTTDAEKTSNVGKYLITPSGAEAKDYTISYEQGELTITKRSLTATSNCSRLYGEDNPLLPIEYIGFVNNETEDVIAKKPIAITTALKTSTVGNYPITVKGGEATNYDFVYKQGILTVTKASLSAKVKDATKVYGTQNPTFSIEYYGLKNGETVPAWTTAPTFQTEATKSSGVGQYAIKAVNGVPVNYDIEIADGTLSITPASLTIKANDATRPYYSDNPAFSYKCNGLVNGDDEGVLISAPTLSTSATQDSNVGTYEIRVGEASCSNYSISYINGTLTITPCILTASVGNYERIYNEENPVFEVMYNGFVGNEDESVLNSKAIANTSATKTSDVGTYKITVSGGSADNYTFSYTSGNLTINKAEQTISWEQDLTGLKVGDQVELKAEASSSLPITYMLDSDAAEVYSAGNNKTYLDCKAVGQFTIRATQDGNKNYYASTRVSKLVTIGDGESSVKSLKNSAVKIQHMSFGIRVSNANVGDLIQIYSIDGVLQKIIKAQEHVIDISLSKDKVYIINIGTETLKLSL